MAWLFAALLTRLEELIRCLKTVDALNETIRRAEIGAGTPVLGLRQGVPSFAAL